MRNALLLVVLASLASVPLVGCGDADPSTIGSRRAPKGGGSTGSGDHDPDDIDNTPDTGNPNANTTPNAPSTPGTSAGEFSVAVSNQTPSADLGSEVTIDVTVTPTNGFKGNADLTATGLPQGATATFSPASVTLNTTPATAKMTVKVPVDAVPSANGQASPVVVTAKSGAVQATANANFKVNPKLTLTIPVNVDALRQAGAGTVFKDDWGQGFGATQKPLRTQQGNGIVVQVVNGDSKAHIVHGNNGFAHGDVNNPIPPNSPEGRTRTLNVGANVNGYPHDGANGPSVSFRIQVTGAN